jgi:hypothetical protein
MKPTAASLAFAALSIAVLSGCSDDAPGSLNPAKLWLALDGSETNVRLADFEPNPY